MMPVCARPGTKPVHTVPYRSTVRLKPCRATGSKVPVDKGHMKGHATPGGVGRGREPGFRLRRIKASLCPVY